MSTSLVTPNISQNNKIKCKIKRYIFWSPYIYFMDINYPVLLIKRHLHNSSASSGLAAAMFINESILIFSFERNIITITLHYNIHIYNYYIILVLLICYDNFCFCCK